MSGASQPHGRALAVALACCVHQYLAAADLALAADDVAAPGSWHAVAPMAVKRTYHGVGVLDGTLYALGGFAFADQCVNETKDPGGCYLASVEAYHPASGNWTQCFTPSASPPCVSIAPMTITRFNVGVGVLGGELYAVGGQHGDHQRSQLASVEKYNPTANSWTPVAPMTEERNGAGVGVLGGLLYAVGGQSCGHIDGCPVSKTVEAYDPTKNTWALRAVMSVPRGNMGVGVAGGRLFAAGGYSGDGPYLSSVEMYNPAANSWTLVKPMSVARVYLSVGVVGGLICKKTS